MTPDIAALVLSYENNPAQFMQQSALLNTLLGDGLCASYAACAQDGLAVWNELGKTILDPQYQDKSDGLAIFNKDYLGEPTIAAPILSSFIRKDLAGLGIGGPGPSKLIYWTVASRSPEQGIGPLAYMNLFETTKGVIICLGNDRSLDFTKTLSWSEIVYQTWKQVQGAQTRGSETFAKGDWLPGGPISNLQHVFHHEVSNEATLKTLETIYDTSKFLARVDEPWRNWTEADTNTKNWFYGLLGTDTCAGIVELLKDHAVEIGRKQITEIRTRWWGDKPDI
ncbi:MAG: hypothetical protein Q9168_003392, partial [Polycauliona sp. 1 TL-2023]